MGKGIPLLETVHTGAPGLNQRIWVHSQGKAASSGCLPLTHINAEVNPSTPNDRYNGRTAPLTSKRFILYIYSTNTGTEYFKCGLYCQFFLSSKCRLFHKSNVFGSCFIHILYTECAKIKKKK